MHALVWFVMLTLAVPQSTPEEQYYRGFYLEVATRDFSGARDAYARAADAAAASKRNDMVARCWLGQARCLKALGKADEAAAVVRKVLEIDPANSEAKAALSAPAAEDQELTQYLDGLIRDLRTAGSERAAKDLVLVGAPAVPPLARSLRSKEVGLVSEAAKVLGLIDHASAIEALRRAVLDPEVVYPEVILSSANSDRWVPVFEAGLASPDVDFRVKVVQQAGAWRERIFKNGSKQEITDFVNLALGDPTVEVRVAVFNARLGLGASAARLSECITAEDSNLRRAALPHAGSSADLEVLFPAVVKNLTDGDATIRQMAVGVISRWASAGNQVTQATRDRCLQAAAASLEDNDAHVAQEAADLVSGMQTPWPEATARHAAAWLRRLIEQNTVTASRTSIAQSMLNSGGAESLTNDQLLSLYVLAGSSGRDADRDLQSVRNRLLSRLLNNARNRHEDLGELLVRGLHEIGDDLGKRALLQQIQPKEVARSDGYVAAANEGNPDLRLLGYSGVLNAPSLGGETVLAHVGEDVRSSNSNLRELARAVAEKFPHPSYAEGLRRAHAEAQGDERARALQTLVACAGKAALPEVREDLASTDDAEVNKACRLIVKLLGNDAVDDLVALAKRTGGSRPTEPFVTGDGLALPPDLVARYVEALPPDKYTGQLLLRVARLESPTLKDVTRKLVTRLLTSTDGSARIAAEFAGKLHIEEAFPQLIALLESPSAGTRDAAKQALADIRSYRELKASFEQFGEGGRAKALQDAKALLKSDSAEKRRGGALAIGALGDPSGVPALLELLSDADASVRAAALQALERLGGKPN